MLSNDAFTEPSIQICPRRANFPSITFFRAAIYQERINIFVKRRSCPGRACPGPLQWAGMGNDFPRPREIDSERERERKRVRRSGIISGECTG